MTKTTLLLATMFILSMLALGGATAWEGLGNFEEAVQARQEALYGFDY